MVDIFTDIEPNFAQIEKDLLSGAGEIETDVMKSFADTLPDEMRSLMSDNPPSTVGSAPAKRTGRLANSLKGELTADDTVEIEMVNYAFYLDPIFEAMGKGGGWANRPFIETAIQKAYDKS